MLTRKITRRIIGIVLTVALIVSSVALAVTAATAVDTSHPGSLCLTYSYDGQSFAEPSEITCWKPFVCRL